MNITLPSLIRSQERSEDIKYFRDAWFNLTSTQTVETPATKSNKKISTYLCSSFYSYIKAPTLLLVLKMYLQSKTNTENLWVFFSNILNIYFTFLAVSTETFPNLIVISTLSCLRLKCTFDILPNLAHISLEQLNSYSWSHMLKLLIHNQHKSAKVAFVRPPLPQNNNHMRWKCPATQGLPVYSDSFQMQQ